MLKRKFVAKGFVGDDGIIPSGEIARYDNNYLDSPTRPNTYNWSGGKALVAAGGIAALLAVGGVAHLYSYSIYEISQLPGGKKYAAHVKPNGGAFAILSDGIVYKLSEKLSEEQLIEMLK